MSLQIDEGEGACVFCVRVQPRSKRNEIAGLHSGALKVRVTAPPVEGKANRAVQELLAKQLGISPSSIEVLTGHTSRQKRVRVVGVSAGAIRALVEEM